ncbi:MAG: hypothetical protein ACREIA_21555 [Opitutaceae bacterium]
MIYSSHLPSGVAWADLSAREWQSIVGTGWSSAIEVGGNGIYRLEKIPVGYQLTLLPDAELSRDLWKGGKGAARAKKVLLRTEPRVVQLKLAGWTGRFFVRSADGSLPVTMADAGQFAVPPGVYILERGE